MNTEINGMQDLIDVRDVIARVEELREERDDHEELQAEDPVTYCVEWRNDAPDDAAELATLEALLSELAGNGGDEEWEGDWYPVTLIRDSHFEQAMDELLEDCGDMPAFDKIPPYLRITVDYAALQMDYTSVDFDGETYWYR